MAKVKPAIEDVEDVDVVQLQDRLIGLEAVVVEQRETLERIINQQQQEIETLTARINTKPQTQTMNFAKIDPDQVFRECLSIAIRLHPGSQSASFLNDPSNVESTCNSATVLAEVMTKAIVEKYLV